MRSALLVRLWAKVSPEPNSGCWLWLGAVGSNGYPLLSVGNRSTRAHRLIWELCFGPIPVGRLVCHRCDVPCCINPGHLFLGTPAENMADMYTKRRGPTGERNGRARLTADQVAEIRQLRDQFSPLELANRFAVSRSAVYLVLKNKSWRQLKAGAA
jgi:hypothetical protein